MDSALESSERGFLRIVEEREESTFGAEFAFDLAGVVCNGYTRNYDGHEKQGANGDRLISRLIPLLGRKTEVRFLFGGGGETNFSWRIEGSIKDADSCEDAEYLGTSFRHSLRMVLASEPQFNFASRQVVAWARPCWAPFRWQTQVAPHGVSLRIPAQAAMGFADANKTPDLKEIALEMAIPRCGMRSFHSLAEGVVLSRDPVLLTVSCRGFVLDGKAREAVADTLKWMQANPVPLRNQLAVQGLAPDLGEQLQEQIQEWLRNRTGGMVRCRIFSHERVADGFAQMLGSDVFGTGVESVTHPISSDEMQAQCALDNHTQPGLDLTCCLHSHAPWPALFPGLDSLAQTRVQRFFNHDAPVFGESGVFLGQIAENPGRTVRMVDSARSQHLYVLGATGTGKSTLLFNMILQDILAGRGIGLIDPHGDLYDQLLEALPVKRAKDVVLFNPGHLDTAPGINPLECSGPNRPQQVNFVINEFLKTFERMYNMRECGGPVFEMYFRNAMLLLLESGLRDVTLTEFSLVFEDGDYRKFLKRRCKNPLVVGFWDNQAEKARGDNALENMAAYISSKINAFTCNALIRPIIGQSKSTVDVRQILDNCGILLVKLPKGILGELDTQLLGSFLLSKVFATAMSRAGMKPGCRSPFHLYVDEFQNFTNDTVAHMLSESRKYGLYLTLANQNLSQLEANAGRQNILDAVLGNVGSLISFRIGPNDAEKLWPYTEPEFGSQDLQSLPNFHAVARLLSTQGPTRPFVFRTLPATKPRGYKRADAEVWAIKERSFTRPIAEVEAQIILRRTAHKSSESSHVLSKATTKSRNCD